MVSHSLPYALLSTHIADYALVRAIPILGETACTSETGVLSAREGILPSLPAHLALIPPMYLLIMITTFLRNGISVMPFHVMTEDSIGLSL